MPENPKESSQPRETTVVEKKAELDSMTQQAEELDARNAKRTEEATAKLSALMDRYQEIQLSLTPEEKVTLEEEMYSLAGLLMKLNTVGFLTEQDKPRIERMLSNLPYQTDVDFRALQTLANSGVGFERRGNNLGLMGVKYQGGLVDLPCNDETASYSLKQTDFIRPTVELTVVDKDGSIDRIVITGGEITSISGI